jgi:hypothetical protein
MASMSPNPFTIPLEKSAAHFEKSAFACEAEAAKEEAPPPTQASPAPVVAVPAAATPSPTPPSPDSSALDTAGSFGTWTDPGHSPDASAMRRAIVKLRRASLSRVVASVVVASVALCLVGAARAAVQAHRGAELEVSHSTRVMMRERPLTASFVTIHDDVVTTAPKLETAAPAHPTKTRRARHAR